MAVYDTRGSQKKPGDYLVEVIGYPREIDAGGFTKIEFEFQIAGDDKTLKTSFFQNQIVDIFQALGFKEIEHGVFDGDIHEAFGKTFLAELYYEEYDKKDGTKGKARRLRNFRLTESVGKPTSVDEVVWEE